MKRWVPSCTKATSTAQGVPYLPTLPRPTGEREAAAYTALVKAIPPERKPPAERADHADRRAERQPRERRTGEGAESALANLKSIELDRQKTRPPDDRVDD